MRTGVALALLSAVLFAGLYYFVTLLDPLEGNALFAWRVLLAMPALALLLSHSRGWRPLRVTIARARRDKMLALMLLCTTATIGVQTWLFVWAPVHGMALDVSLGYLLLPLMMVVVGRVFYKEQLSRAQQVAVGLAACGVLHELLVLGHLSWATAVVLFGYPPYFMLHRRLRLGSVTTLWIEMGLLSPIALGILLFQDLSIWQMFAQRPALLGLIPLLGIMSSVALIAYISASRRLPLGLFGILGYVEPVLLFWVAVLLLHETPSLQAWFTYVPIWIAVAVMAVEGMVRWRRNAPA
ncbi:MAG: EamA family transporter RarD [Castellaniella sp.]